MSLRNRRLAAVLASTALLATPASALAQSAGDDQYADPLGGDTPSQGSGNSGNSGSQGNGGGNNTQQAPSTSGQSSSGNTQSSPQTTAPQSAAPSAGQQLPRTGLDAGLPAALGVVLLALGLVLRRRTAGSLG